MFRGDDPPPILNPDVPSEHMIPGGLRFGDTVFIQGSIPPHMSKGSGINLKPQMGSENDIHFHMSIRFHENCIVRNTSQGGRWGKEERDGGMPLTQGQKFKMHITVREDFFEVSVNDQHFCDYKHRAPFEEINTIGFFGEFEIQRLSIYYGRSLSVPSEHMIPGGLRFGHIVVIQGFIPPHMSKGSGINLKPQMGSENDIHFHMSIRFHENCIVRNTSQGSRWGKEERGGGMPLTKGQNFQMLIAVHQNCFKVSVNGRHFCDYNHRAAFQQINTIGFFGEFQIQSVSFQQDPSLVAPGYPSYPTGAAAPPAYSPYPGNAPIFNPPVPYNGGIAGGLYPGRMINIQGTVHPSPDRFFFNLNAGGDVAFHFNPRFKEGCIVRNSRTAGRWAKEERYGPGLPIGPGSMFDLKVMVEPNCYKVAVNNQHYCEFNHRLPQLHTIQGLEIGGDIQLSQIFIQ